MRVNWKPGIEREMGIARAERDAQIKNALEHIRWDDGDIFISEITGIPLELRTLLQSAYLTESCGQTLPEAKATSFEDWVQRIIDLGSIVMVTPYHRADGYVIHVQEYLPSNPDQTAGNIRMYQYPPSL